MDTYAELIARKDRRVPSVGFTAEVNEPWLFPFQQHAVRWALLGGRRALFEDTGLGKSRQQLAWADKVSERTGERVLILAPLAVGPQTVREARKIGMDDVVFARRPEDAGAARIVVTNYDSLDRFDTFGEAGVVADESGILKNFAGKTQLKLRDRFAQTPYRLPCSATPAPNDYVELGTHAEFLGHGTRQEMLARFFVNDLSDTKKWRLKGHAVEAFWDWVASWALCAGLPSDIGPYSDEGYVLPPLRLHKHIVDVDLVEGRAEGSLMRLGNMSATGIHGEKRRTAEDRAARVAEIVATKPGAPWLIWVDTDYEAKAVRDAVPSIVEVSGSMKSEIKEERLLGFVDRGGILMTKPKIAGHGMNWQHCADVVFAGGSYSYEAFYQPVRRNWRFGQTQEVNVHVVMAFTEQHLWEVVSGKADDHEAMKQQMFAASRRAQARKPAMSSYNPTHVGRWPAWLTSNPPEMVR